MIRIALLDDHPALLAGLRRLLEAQPGLTVVAAAATPEELARRLLAVRPDVLIIDHEDGLTLCRRIHNRRHPPAVVLYSAGTPHHLVLAARAAQAGAVVDKSAPVEELVAAIHLAAAGEATFPDVPRDAYASAVARIDDEDLPVLAMLLDGEPVRSIAQTLRREPDEIAWRAQRITGRLSAAPALR